MYGHDIPVEPTPFGIRESSSLAQCWIPSDLADNVNLDKCFVFVDSSALCKPN